MVMAYWWISTLPLACQLANRQKKPSLGEASALQAGIPSLNGARRAAHTSRVLTISKTTVLTLEEKNVFIVLINILKYFKNCNETF